MKYVEWTSADICALENLGLSRIVTEIDDGGKVRRELGFDASGLIIHRHPGLPTKAAHGLFDLAIVKVPMSNAMTSQAFEDLWSG